MTNVLEIPEWKDSGYHTNPAYSLHKGNVDGFDEEMVALLYRNGETVLHCTIGVSSANQFHINVMHFHLDGARFMAENPGVDIGHLYKTQAECLAGRKPMPEPENTLLYNYKNLQMYP